MRPIIQILILITLVTLAAATTADWKPSDLPDPEEVYPSPFDWENFRVLHIGDSQVFAGLSNGLRRRFKSADANYRLEGWVGSRAKSWIVSGKLARLLRGYAPHAVIVTLGTNAMHHPNPQVYATWVKKVVNRIGPRQCYWIGPPPLLEDKNDFNGHLKRACGDCRYFDSRPLEFPPRPKGKFHLTRKEGEVWAAQVWDWMNDPNNRPKKTRNDHAL